MSDQEKFEAFKENLIKENEANYGSEIRKAYSDKTIDKSNAKLRGLSPEEYKAMQAKEQEVLALLPKALATNDYQSEATKQLVQAHKEWLMYSWKSYSKEAHRGLATMYQADERFANYYNQIVDGGAAFLSDAILKTLN